MAEDGTHQASMASLRTWAARLSQPSVQLLLSDNHIIIRDGGELLASGALVRNRRLDAGKPPSGRPDR